MTEYEKLSLTLLSSLSVGLMLLASNCDKPTDAESMRCWTSDLIETLKRVQKATAAGADSVANFDVSNN